MPFAEIEQVQELESYMQRMRTRAKELEAEMSLLNTQATVDQERIADLGRRYGSAMRLLNEDAEYTKHKVEVMKKSIILMIADLKNTGKAEDFSRLERRIDNLDFEHRATRNDLKKQHPS